VTDVSVAFDRIADRYDATRGGIERGRRFAEAMARWIGPGERVVELGIGTGVIAQALRERGIAVVGIDLSVPMLVRARERLGDCVVRGDGYRPPLRPGAADVVVITWVLQLVPDAPAFLDAAAGLLALGGRLLVVPSEAVRSADDVTSLLDGMQNVLRPAGMRHASGIVAALPPSLELIGRDRTASEAQAKSPADLAAEIRARTWSSLWDLDEPTWARVVAPVLAQLEALPEPRRPRPQVSHHDVLVLGPR